MNNINTCESLIKHTMAKSAECHNLRLKLDETEQWFMRMNIKHKINNCNLELDAFLDIYHKNCILRK
jgi:hypothetical protein